MNSALVKASKAVKGITSTVRSHLDAVERAREVYLAQIKRAEADYFDRITRATEIITGVQSTGSEASETPASSVPPSEQAADNPNPAA